MLFAPGKVIFEDDGGADGVEDLFPPGAEGAGLGEDIGGFAGGLPFVPHPDGQAAPDLKRLGQFPALFGAFALGAVHVQRQAHHDELGMDLGGDLAHPRRHLRAGFQGDLRRDGGGEEFGGVAGGKAGAAGSVVNG